MNISDLSSLQLAEYVSAKSFNAPPVTIKAVMESLLQVRKQNMSAQKRKLTEAYTPQFVSWSSSFCSGEYEIWTELWSAWKTPSLLSNEFCCGSLQCEHAWTVHLLGKSVNQEKVVECLRG